MTADLIAAIVGVAAALTFIAFRLRVGRYPWQLRP